jgi:hypothetical protein
MADEIDLVEDYGELFLRPTLGVRSEWERKPDRKTLHQTSEESLTFLALNLIDVNGSCAVAFNSGDSRGVPVAKLSYSQIMIEPGTEMGRQVAIVLYFLAMVAVIVGVDFAFFRNRFWERLTVNIGIVLVFATLYLRFLRHP